jgi:EpsI family protein
LLVIGGAVNFYISGRHEILPERQRFVSFPLDLGLWHGQRQYQLEADVEQVLKPDDYILSDYSNAKNDVVNFYVAYYASQRKGYSPHSPIVCIPGGGWQITKFERTSYHSKSLGLTLPLNRVIIAQGNNKALVYYWFVQRGRPVANEYWAKWLLFVDAIAKNRTDGALVRLVTPFYPGESEHAADERLQSFIEVLEPHLDAYLPRETVPDAKSVLYERAGRQS